MNKVLVITGASRGIGAATACLAGAAGYSVCANYRQNQAAAERVVAARAILWLLSDEASFTTGAFIDVIGGK